MPEASACGGGVGRGVVVAGELDDPVAAALLRLLVDVGGRELDVGRDREDVVVVGELDELRARERAGDAVDRAEGALDLAGMVPKSFARLALFCP